MPPRNGVGYAAATAMMMRSVANCEIKSWGLRLIRRKGCRRAIVAVARKLAVVMHRMWAGRTEFRQKPLDGAACTEPSKIDDGIVPFRTRSVDDAENGCRAIQSARLSWALHDQSETCMQRYNRAGPIMTAKRSFTRMRDPIPKKTDTKQ